MPVDPHAERLLAMLGAGRRTDWGTVTADKRRSGFAGLMRMAGRAPATGPVEAGTLAGPDGPLATRLYRPERDGTGPRPGLVYFHGGGLVAGDLDTHDVLCRSLAAGSGCRVLSVAYRLAPEHPCPAPFDDAVAALAQVLVAPGRFGLDPDRIAVGGDSAGGTLAIAAALAACRGAGPRPAALLLLCPVLAVTPQTPSRAAFADGFLLDAAMMARDLADAAPEPADPRLSPLSATDLSGLPPTLIHTAEHDPLRDEGALFAARLVEAGVPVEHRCHPGMIHHFYGLMGFIPAARVALDGIAAGLRQALSGRGA